MSDLIIVSERTEKSKVSGSLLDFKEKQVNSILCISTIFFAHFPFHPIHKNELKYYSDSEHHNPFVENTTLGLLWHKTGESVNIVFHKVGRAGPQGHIPSHLAAILP